jgi:hypothetical protein
MGILSSLLGFGEGPPTPTGGTIVQEAQLAKEIAPFMQDLLKKGQALYKARTEEGYRPFEGQTLAELTPEQEQAMTGLTGLVGTTAPAFEEATGLARGVADKLTPTALEEYMSPYQQAVTDIEKAEAQKTFERDILPKVRQAQIGAGAFGGTRGTMLEAQSLADQQKLLGDIQTRGSQSAYTEAARAFEAQKQREGATASALATLAPQALKTAGTEYELLRGVGQEKQQRSQQALDEAYKQYLEERVHPERTLGQYQSVIAGFPSAQTTRTVQTTTPPQQSGLGSILGTLGNIGSLYGTFGGLSQGGLGSGFYPLGSSRATGGPVLYRQGGTGVQPQYLPTPAPQYGGMIRDPRSMIQNIPTIADIPTGLATETTGLPSIISPPQQPTSELEAANQTALASGQPEFTYDGTRYAADPAGPIPIGEAARLAEEEFIPGPVVQGLPPEVIQGAPEYAMPPLVTHAAPVAGPANVEGPFLGTKQPEGPTPMGLLINPSASGGLVDLPVVRRQLNEQVLPNNQEAFFKQYGVSLPEGKTSVEELTPKEMEALGVQVNLRRMMQPRVSDTAYADLLTSKEATLGEEKEIARQQAIIRALRGFSKGVSTGAGTGFWGEMQTGIGEAAEETMKYGEEASQKLLDLKKDINEFKLKAELAREAGDDATADKFNTIAKQLMDRQIQQEEIEAKYLLNQSKSKEMGLTEEFNQGTDGIVALESILSKNKAGSWKAGATILNIDNSTSPPTTTEWSWNKLFADSVNAAWDKFKTDYDMGKIDKDMVNQQWGIYVTKEMDNFLSGEIKIKTKGGGQVIKKQAGSMIDKPVQEKTTGEVLRELKGLRK